MQGKAETGILILTMSTKRTPLFLLQITLTTLLLIDTDKKKKYLSTLIVPPPLLNCKRKIGNSTIFWEIPHFSRTTTVLS